jgi:hypothetical protein
MSTEETHLLNTKNLLEQKIEARKRLLELDPKKAQQHVDQVLYPQYWEVIDGPLWEDSLEVDSAETNA